MGWRSGKESLFVFGACLGDFDLLRVFAMQAGASLDESQNNLQTVTEELAQLYHHVCTVNGQTPTRVVLDHEKEGMTPSKFFLIQNNIGYLIWFYQSGASNQNFTIRKKGKNYNVINHKNKKVLI